VLLVREDLRGYGTSPPSCWSSHEGDPLTRHALEALAEREIDREDAEQALSAPTATLPGLGNRTVHVHRYHDRVLDQELLLCVVTEDHLDEFVIVTVYKTSKFEKYLRGGTR
jgi:hypothetical protein